MASALAALALASTVMAADAAQIVSADAAPTTAAVTTTTVTTTTLSPSGCRPGAEFKVNTSSAYYQIFPDVAGDAEGNFVVAWGDYDELLVLAQRFDNLGRRLGGEFQVNTTTTGYHAYPSVGMDQAGNFLVSWKTFDDTTDTCRGRAFHSDGSPVAEDFVVTCNSYFGPSVGATGAGQFVVTWSNGAIGGRPVALDGTVGTDFSIGYGGYSAANLAADASGGFLVVWSAPDGSSDGVFGRRFGADFHAAGDAFQMNTTTRGYQTGPGITATADGFLVSWRDAAIDDPPQDVVARRFDTTGTPTSGEFVVSTYRPSIKGAGRIAVDAHGGFVVVWTSIGQNAGRDGVFGQRFDATGAPIGGEFVVNERATRGGVGVVGDPDGNFVVLFTNVNGRSVYGRRFDCTGTGPIAADIIGRVLDADGMPLGAAYVEACIGGTRCTVVRSDASGAYRVGGLLPDRYDVTAFAPASRVLIPATVGPLDVAEGAEVVAPDIVLTEPVPLPAGSTLTTGGVTTTGGLPRVYRGDPFVIATRACPDGTAGFEVRRSDTPLANGALVETSPGRYEATVPVLGVSTGPVHVTITVTCPDGPPAIAEFDVLLYVDPSGTVRDLSGTPLADATVTLLRAESPDGPYVAVPDGDGLMSPANRHNPDGVDAVGRFFWDVVAGLYKVRAERSGCHAPGGEVPFVETPSLAVPPPVVDLDLRLDCAAVPPSTTTTVPTLCTPGGCDDGDPCTDDTCVPNRGCESVSIAGLAGATCVCGRALPSACAAVQVPRSVTSNAAKACTLLEKAATAPSARKRNKLLHAVAARWSKAAHALHKRKNRSLGAECIEALDGRYGDARSRADRATER